MKSLAWRLSTIPRRRCSAICFVAGTLEDDKVTGCKGDRVRINGNGRTSKAGRESGGEGDKFLFCHPVTLSPCHLVTNEGVVLPGMAELAAAGAGVADGWDRRGSVGVRHLAGSDIHGDGRLEHAPMALALSPGTDVLAMGR